MSDGGGGGGGVLDSPDTPDHACSCNNEVEKSNSVHILPSSSTLKVLLPILAELMAEAVAELMAEGVAESMAELKEVEAAAVAVEAAAGVLVIVTVTPPSTIQ